MSARDTLLKLLHDNGTDIHSFVGLTNGFSKARELPNWRKWPRFCQANGERLGKRAFVDNMTTRTVWREPTERQAKCLKSIFLKLGGKL